MKKILLLLLFVTGISSADDFLISASLRSKLIDPNAATSGVARDQNGVSIATDFDNNGSITYAEAAAIYSLTINNANISSLEGLENFVNLTNLSCSSNPLTSTTQLVGLTKLNTLNCSSCLIEILTLPSSTSSPLKILICISNTVLTTIQNLSTSKALTNLNVSSCTSLNQIDANKLIKLEFLFIENCLTLNTLLIKNGKNTIIIGISDVYTPVLNYICVDEARIQFIKDLINPFLSVLTCNVSSLCTDSPGGNFNTIKGKLTLNNSLVPQSFCKLKCTIGGATLFTTTNALGEYRFYTTQTGNFVIEPVFENPAGFLDLDFTGSISNLPDTVVTVNCVSVTAPNSVTDIETMIAPLTTSIPNKRAYLVTIKNKGNQLVTNGTMSLSNNQNVVLNLPATIPGISLNAATTTVSNWGFTNIAPLQSKSFSLLFDDNTTTEQLIAFQANIVVVGDITISDNTCVLNQSGEPAANSISCIEGEVLPSTAVGSYLHYMINFENQDAQSVNDIIIENTFDPLKFDIASLQIIGSTIDSIYPDTVAGIDSHPAILDVKENKATYSFRKGGLTGDPNGHGGVLLKIKTKSDLPVGSSVNNSVKITFDYDAPLVTNNEVTTFQNLSVNQPALDASIVVYPNPATSIIKVSGDYNITSVQVYDAAGRLLQTNLDNATNYTLDIANKAVGVYFLKITSDKGSKVERIVKQ